MNFTDLRLRFRRFLRNNGKILFIVVILWVVVFMINLWIKKRPTSTVPKTSYEPHVSVMSSSSKVSPYLQETYDDYIEKYVNYCNEEEFNLAFNMISDECKKFRFNNDIAEFKNYLISIMPLEKQHSIQNYSNLRLNDEMTNIYQVKYFDDILATGLTNSEYNFTEEKISFTEGENGQPSMNVANYIFHEDIKKITENEYLKIDVLSKDVYYSIEEYTVRLTNRSEYTIVISDNTEDQEICLKLNNEVRDRIGKDDIVIAPGLSRDIELTFLKFADDNDTCNELRFNNVRVMENYSGATEEVDGTVIENEKNNAIAKFSSSVSLR